MTSKLIIVSYIKYKDNLIDFYTFLTYILLRYEVIMFYIIIMSVVHVEKCLYVVS